MADMFGTIGAIGTIFLSDKALKSGAYNGFEEMLLHKINDRAQSRLRDNGINFEITDLARAK